MAKTYKKITEKDNSATVTGRVTFPVGTSVLSGVGIAAREGIDPQTGVTPNWKLNLDRVKGDKESASNPSTAAVGALSGGNGMIPPSIPVGGSLSGDKQGTLGSNPTVGIYNAVGSWIQNIASGFKSQSKVYPQYAASFPDRSGQAKQTQIAGEKNYTSLSGGSLSGDKQGSQTNRNINPYTDGRQFFGTAGMYTYGQFSDPLEAFNELLKKNVPTNIPSYMADQLGLTTNLQAPDSGWQLVNGNWVETSNGSTGGTGYVDEQPKWVRDRYGRVIRNKYFKGNYLYGDLGNGEMKGGYGGGGEDYDYSYDNTTNEPAPFSGSYGVINFNVASG